MKFRGLERIVQWGVIVIGVALGFIWLLGWFGPDRPHATAQLGTLTNPGDAYDPVAAGEPLPEGYRNTLRRDDIVPVYDPEFVSVDKTGWSDESLVIGIEIDGEAKAYPVAHLNHREMVIDRLAGTPILVSW